MQDNDNITNHEYWNEIEQWLENKRKENTFSATLKHFIKTMLVCCVSLAAIVLLVDAFLNTIGFNLGFGDAIINAITN